MTINESAENYLETILILSKKLPVVRSVDIAEELGFKKPSVSVAMKHLREKEHIIVDKSGFITLTPAGREIAEMIYERHQLLSSWLIQLGVPEKTAVEDACKIEHVISKESFRAIKDYVGNIVKVNLHKREVVVRVEFMGKSVELFMGMEMVDDEQAGNT